MARADVLVLPSCAEGMSMVVLEALALGLAVITTAAGGSMDFLENSRNCLLVSPGDVPAICPAICKVVESPDLRSALGREAHVLRNRSTQMDTWKSSSQYNEKAPSCNQPGAMQLLYVHETLTR
jgi:glycosyltransferase involved in cell wall biosynthesis